MYAVPLASRKSNTRTMAGASCRLARVRPSATKRSRPQVKSSAALVERGRTGRAVLAHGKRQRQVFLDGDLAAELAVARPVGDAESALPQDGDDLVAPDHPSRRQRDEIDR